MEHFDIHKAVAKHNREVCGGYPPAVAILVYLAGGVAGVLATCGFLIAAVYNSVGHGGTSCGFRCTQYNGGYSSYAHPDIAALYFGLVLAAAGGTALLIKWGRKWQGRLISIDGGREDERHQKGTKILHVKDAAYHLPTPTGALTIAGIPLPASVEQQHILLAGAPGSGKSEALKTLIAQVRARGNDGAVIHDPTGEFVSLFYDPKRGDMIINPLDARHAPWDLWSDLQPGEEANLAKAIIPSATGDNKYFSDAAQALLEVLFQQTHTIDDLVKAGLGESAQELVERLERAGMGGLAGNVKTFGSVRGNLAPYLRSLALLPPVPPGLGINLAEFCEKPKGRFVFLLTRRRNKDALRPLHQLFLTQIVSTATSLRPDPTRRIWLFLDELPELMPSDAVATSLSQGRKFGLSSVLAVQEVGQMYDRVGQYEARALLSMPKTRLVLRVGDGESAEAMSKEIGDRQIQRRQVSSSQAPAGGESMGTRNTTSTTWQTTTERAVLPAEIMALPDLNGYLRIEASTMRVTLRYTPRTTVAEDYKPVPPRPLPVAERKEAEEK